MGEEGVSSHESSAEPVTLSQNILDDRMLDRILGYVRMKMDVALAANSELSATRTQIAQMGAFILVAFVIGTGGVQALMGWDNSAMLIAGLSAMIVGLMVMSITKTSARYTDIVMDEFLAFDTLYSLIVWEEVDDIAALTEEIKIIEQSTRSKIDNENRHHRILTGTILHSMIHYERHSPFPDDIGASRHRLPMTDVEGHRD